MFSKLLNTAVHYIKKIAKKIFSYKGVATLGSILIMLSVFYIWFEEPLMFRARALSLHPTKSFGLEKAKIKIISIGTFFLFLGVCSLASLYFGLYRVQFFLSICGLLFLLLFIDFHFLNNINQLEFFIDNFRQTNNIIKFSIDYLPPNRGFSAIPDYVSGTESLYNRFIYLFSCGKTGLLLCLIGNLSILGINFKKSFLKKSINLKGWHLVVITIIISAFGLTPSLRSTYHIREANKYFNQANYQLAAQSYEIAAQKNSKLLESSSYWAKLGKSYYILQRVDKPFYHYYKTIEFLEKNKFHEAIEELRLAEKKSRAKTVIKNTLARVYIEQGLWLFSRNQTQGSIKVWQKALDLNPLQIEAHYYIAKAYYDSAQYHLAIKENILFIEKSINNSLKSNSYSNIGDCYNKLGFHAKAREAYLRSYYIDNRGNIRAYENLSGI
jgi:tetratricopeptide (TPR) repeat protein